MIELSGCNAGEDVLTILLFCLALQSVNPASGSLQIQAILISSRLLRHTTPRSCQYPEVPKLQEVLESSVTLSSVLHSDAKKYHRLLTARRRSPVPEMSLSRSITSCLIVPLHNSSEVIPFNSPISWNREPNREMSECTHTSRCEEPQRHQTLQPIPRHRLPQHAISIGPYLSPRALHIEAIPPSNIYLPSTNR